MCVANSFGVPLSTPGFHKLKALTFGPSFGSGRHICFHCMLYGQISHCWKVKILLQIKILISVFLGKRIVFSWILDTIRNYKLKLIDLSVFNHYFTFLCDAYCLREHNHTESTPHKSKKGKLFVSSGQHCSPRVIRALVMHCFS